jgi:hypothetical protein
MTEALVIHARDATRRQQALLEQSYAVILANCYSVEFKKFQTTAIETKPWLSKTTPGVPITNVHVLMTLRTMKT